MQDNPVIEARASASAGTHIAGLDLFRFLLLLSVIVSHGFFLRAAYVSGPNHLAWPSKIITVFAMESFFLISGYVTATAASIDGSWLNKRVKRLGIPLLFTVLVINNVTIAINPVVYRMPLGIHAFHAWFIAALFAHAVVLRFCAGQIDKLVPILERRLTRTNILPVILGLLLVYEFLVAILFKLTSRGEDRLEVELLIDNLLIYLPFFLGGYLLSRSSSLRDLLRRLIPALAVIAAAAIPCAIFVGLDGTGNRTLDTVALVMLKTCIGFASSVLILLWALAIRSVSPVVRFLSQGSYAVYVVHLLIVNVLFRLYAAAGGGGVYGPALLVTLLTLLISYAVYGLVIRHSTTLRLLVTGSTAGGAGAGGLPRGAVRSI